MIALGLSCGHVGGSSQPGILLGPLHWEWSLSHWANSCFSVAQLCPTLFDPMNCSTPGFPVIHCLPEFAQTHVHWVMMPSNHLILCRPLLLLPSIFPSITVFSNVSHLRIRWPKYWSFSFSISSSNEYSGLISFRMDWFDLLAVQGTLGSLLQHHNSSALSLLYSPTLYIRTWLLEKPKLGLYGPLSEKWSLCFLMSLSRFVVAFLPRSKHLLISWLQLPSSVILETKRIKSASDSPTPPSICHEVMGPDAEVPILRI